MLQANAQLLDLSYKTVDASLLVNPGRSASTFYSLDEKDLPKTLIGDELRFKQILINLVKNAIKFTRKRNGFVHILVGYDATCDRLIVVVADSGVGITQEEMPLLC